jgi:acyl-coenzyme A thioesterase 7
MWFHRSATFVKPRRSFQAGRIKNQGIKQSLIRTVVTTTTTTSRVMLPDDSNPAGNVHGGVILKMLEECGIITAQRHLIANRSSWANKDIPPPSVALARVDRVDFENPMHIGNLAQLDAQVTFAGKKSIEVQVKVSAEDLQTGQTLQTNKARLWYVVVDEFNTLNPGWQKQLGLQLPPKLAISKYDIPPLRYSSPQEEEAANARYAAQKESRNPSKNKLEAVSSIRRPGSAPVLSYVALSSDCYRSGSIYGGVIMKLMDTAAGVTAVRYCKTNCVTASVEALNMLSPVFLGNIIRVFAHPTFTSSRTLEVAVYVEAEDVFTGNSWQAVSAHLTFVSLDKNGKVLPVPALKPQSHEARVDYALGEERYRLRKLQREKSAK